MGNELLRFARLAMATARRVAPCCRLSQYADPTDHLASLLAALLLREQLRLTYRAAEDRLCLADRRRRRLGLRIVPDHATRWRFGRRQLTPGLLAAALGETVAWVAGSAGRGGWPSPRPASGSRTRSAGSSGGPSATAARAAG
jgi:hypothetical protein